MTPTQETWRAWAIDDLPEVMPLLNRAQFLERLTQHGIEATEADLRWWEWEGYLPRPERRWDPEVKARRAYYPIWMLAAVFALRELQTQGCPLKDMGPALKDAAQRAARAIHKGASEGDDVWTLALEAGNTASVQFLGRQLLDRQARKFLSMSGEEFVREYRAGTIRNPCSLAVARVAILLPLADEQQGATNA